MKAGPRTKHGLTSAQQIELHNACACLRKYGLKIVAQLRRSGKPSVAVDDVIVAIENLANADLLPEKPA